LHRELREFKRAPLLEADEKDAFAVLRHHALRVNDGRVQMVAQRVGERVINDLKCPALVVTFEILHVLQHKRGGLVVFDDFRQREEQVALLLVVKAVRLAEAQFFGDARDAERLAGKTGAQDVVRRNVRHHHGMDVAVGRLAEIGGVGLLRVFVPVGGEYALAPGAFKGEPETADAAEEVNEFELWRFAGSVDAIRNRFLAERGVFRFAAFAHASTPLHSSAVERPNALASLATFLMPGLRRPRSMSLM